MPSRPDELYGQWNVLNTASTMTQSIFWRWLTNSVCPRKSLALGQISGIRTPKPFSGRTGGKGKLISGRSHACSDLPCRKIWRANRIIWNEEVFIGLVINAIFQSSSRITQQGIITGMILGSFAYPKRLTRRKSLVFRKTNVERYQVQHLIVDEKKNNDLNNNKMYLLKICTLIWYSKIRCDRK